MGEELGNYVHQNMGEELGNYVHQNINITCVRPRSEAVAWGTSDRGRTVPRHMRPPTVRSSGTGDL